LAKLVQLVGLDLLVTL